MKQFILLVRVPADYSPETARAVNPAWNAVTDKWKADGIWVSSFVFPGNSFVVTGTSRQISSGYVLADNRKLVSAIILLATDQKEAVLLAGACPVLDHGGSVEVKEVPPRPVPGVQP